MKINFNNHNIYQKGKYTQPQFKGKGIDMLNAWMRDENIDGIRLNYYKEIMRDLSEGVKLYFEANQEIDDSVKNFHECGGLTLFFDMPNDEILKVSLENPLEYRKHCPEFDIPFLSPVEKYGKTYIVKQPKADTKGITHEHFKDVTKRIYSHGCELSRDGNKYEQYGIYNGKAYLIDTRCAMPMPNLYTIIIDNICKKINKCYVWVSEKQWEAEKAHAYMEKGYLSYHVDETPRKSLKFKDGLIKLFQTVKNNIKYRKNHYYVPYEISRVQQLKLPKIMKMKA